MSDKGLEPHKLDDAAELNKLAQQCAVRNESKVEESETEIKFALDKNMGLVVMDLGAQTKFVGLTADQADTVADILKKKAQELRELK